MDLTLVQGGSRHKVSIEEDAKVQDLMNLVTVTTQIPTFNQKLIYKGVAIIKDAEKKLTELGIKNNSKIMVIGQRHDPEEEQILKQLEETAKSIEKIHSKLKDLSSDLDSLKKGFMEASLLPKSVERLKKSILHCTEDGMKAIEFLDGLLVDEKYKDARSKKKRLITKIQTVLDDCDKTAEEVATVGGSTS